MSSNIASKTDSNPFLFIAVFLSLFIHFGIRVSKALIFLGNFSVKEKRSNQQAAPPFLNA